MSSTTNTLHKAFGIDAAAHGDLTGTCKDATVNLQVIALGLSRTGTTSLQSALTRLGYGPSHQGVDLFRSLPRLQAFIDIDRKLLSGTWRAGDPELTSRLRDLMTGYRSSTDNPINNLPDEIYAAYPNAKYILTIRPEGKEGWWKSMVDATGWHSRRDVWRYVFRFLIWPVNFLRLTDDRVQGSHERWRRRYGTSGQEVYDRHNSYIQQLIPKEQLLVYDIREGWEPVCHFLRVPVPDEPYPRLNETDAMRAIYFGMMAYGAFTWTIYIGTAAAIGYVARHPKAAQDVARGAVDFAKRLLTLSSIRA